MNTISDIAAAAEKLRPDEFLRLRRRLDRWERKLWERDSAQASENVQRAGISDDHIDRMITRRRRESRR